MSEWISVDDRLPQGGQVLICFLEPFFGKFTSEISTGYYDHPEHYVNPEDGTGWRFWGPDRPVVGPGVTHWMPLPEPPEPQFDDQDIASYAAESFQEKATKG